MAESTALGFGQGAAAAPKLDWVPTSVGQNHQPGNVAMRDSVEASIAAAYGVPAAYLNMNATAPALREVKRLAFLNRTIPLSSLMAEELTEKLSAPVAIDWPNLADQSIDVHLRARAASAAAELVPDSATPADARWSADVSTGKLIVGSHLEVSKTSGDRRGSIPCKATRKRGRADVIRGARRMQLGGFNPGKELARERQVVRLPSGSSGGSVTPLLISSRKSCRRPSK